MDKEKYSFLRPTGIDTYAFIFSAGALQWLHGTTTDDDGREIGNFTLFGDLFRRTAFNAMGYGQEAHTPSVGRTGKAGTHRYLPFKGSVSYDISVPPAMDDCGR